MPITYGYRFEIVRLPGRRRQHFVAAISGNFLPLPGTLGDDIRPVPDWAEIEQEFLATAVDPDRWLVWRADTTVCGKSGPWTRDVGDNYQHCGRCLELAIAAFDAAPAEARVRVAATPKSPTREI